MAQFDFGNLESPLSGTVFINGNLEPWRDALHSSHKGGSRPSYAVEGMLWVNDTTNPWVLNMFDGANDIAIGSFDTTTNAFTPSGVSQAAEDISFDNTDSGLAATNVQDAIDEAVSDFSDFEGRADGFATAAQGELADTALQPGEAVASTELTDWVAYTPVFTGFGTVSSVAFFSRRVGDTLYVRGKFVSGTPSATEARVELGFNGSSGGLTIDSSKVPTGVSQANGNFISGSAQFNTLVEPSVGYFTFSAFGSLTKVNGSAMTAGGVTYVFNGEAPISGW